MNIGIIGCGAIGHKRAKSLEDCRVTWAADPCLERAESLARLVKTAKPTSDWRQLMDASDVEAVIVSTSNDALAPVTLAAIQAGKHVLVEKPVARTVEELKPVVEAARRNRVVVKAGFNHRFHPAFVKAKEIIDSGQAGPLMFIRARYGHGGRLGYEKEWRGNPALSGGGELIDQGVHLIDLSRWFLGEFEQVDGFLSTYYWDMKVEDNAFLALQTASAQMAWLHVSCTEWKNLFSFEIYGRDAKLQIDGLGGSYGVEKLAFYKMLPQMGPPETTVYEYPQPDRSWDTEFQEWAQAIRQGREPSGSLQDAKAALEIVEKIYALHHKPHLIKAKV